MPEFGSIITTAGAALEATAIASGKPVVLSSFVVGDGGGNPVTPDPDQTALVNEIYRGPISLLAVTDATQVLAQLVIPRASGGYVIREIGILSEDGTLYSVSNYPETTKPDESSGLAMSLELDYALRVSSTENVTVVFEEDDFLTERRADTLYLQTENCLSEIAAQGMAQQAAARASLGLGTAAIHNAEDFVPPDLSPYIPRSEADARYVQGMQLVGRTGFETDGTFDFPAGCVLTSLGDFGADNGFGNYSALQRNIGGAWVTIGGP